MNINNNNSESGGAETPEDSSWLSQLTEAYKSPLGLIGVSITTIFFILSVFGLLLHATGTMENPYTPILTAFIFPAGMLFGLLLIPLAMFLRRRKMFQDTLLKKGFRIDLGNSNHRKNIILFCVLTSINVAVFSVAAYEGYHYMDSPEFCGIVCHEIMEPEYTTYQQSPHSNVICVECHIAPGVSGLLRAKFSGLRQLKGVLTGDYQRPVPVPVHGLPPAEVTCEGCHSPEAFIGTKTKKFVSYSNDDQMEPNEEQDIVLHIGGLNPVSETQEGIHWHVMDGLKIEYIALNDQRTEIGSIRMTKPDGEVVFYNADAEGSDKHGWRTMDCTDCHNRAAHIYDDLEEKVDFGLLSKRLNPEIEGLREDSLTVLQKEYESRDQAKKAIEADLLKLQEERHGADFVKENSEALAAAVEFVREAYLKNIWPAVGVTWGTYTSHLGHKYEEDGFGCFRCHDDSRESEAGDVIAQDCDLCHEEP